MKLKQNFFGAYLFGNVSTFGLSMRFRGLDGGDGLDGLVV
jgi:hypothetical protein